MQQITADVLSYGADIVVITESWLKQRHTDEAFSIPGFDIFRRDRPHVALIKPQILYRKNCIHSI